MNSEKDCIRQLDHFQDEESKGVLGGMAWDEVNWMAHYLTHDYRWTKSELNRRWPILFDWPPAK